MPYRYIAVAHTSACTPSTYGIRALQSTPSGWVECAFIPDVALDHAFVETLAQKCTDGQLDPVQLMDVVLDNLA